VEVRRRASAGDMYSRWVQKASAMAAVGTVTIAAVVLAGSVMSGLAAAALGRLTEAVWTMPGHHAPAKWLADHRRRRSQVAGDQVSTTLRHS
jgi:hypothetical protein